jgi:glycosyltransferase involved in cell wall biosynthesis
MDKDTKKVSIVIITRNRAEMLNQCLAALVEQTYPADDFEVLVVNDGSTDHTSDIIHRWEDDSRLNVRGFYVDKLGYSKARNVGVKNAHGEIISFTDDDCIPEKNWVERVVGWFDERSEVDAVGQTTIPVFRNSLLKNLNHDLKIGSPKEFQIIQGMATSLLKIRPFSTCNLHILKDSFERIGGFDSEIPQSEDPDLILRLLEHQGTLLEVSDLNVLHYERDRFIDIIKRWFRFGKSDAWLVKKYFGKLINIEWDLFHGITRRFNLRFKSPVTMYLQVNLSKVLLFILLVTFFSPLAGLLSFLLLLGGFFIKQRKPTKTISFLAYSVVSQISYLIGTTVGSIKNRVIFL